MTADQLLSLTNAARRKAMTPSLLSYYLRMARGPKVEEIDGRKFFPVGELDAWVPVKLARGRKPKP